MDIDWQNQITHGIEHLSARDPNIATLIAIYPRPSFSPHTNYYQALVESVIGQQLSVKAAATIKGRFIDSFGHFPLPEELIEKTEDELRAVGLSYSKARYIQDLARHILDGSVRFEHLASLPNDQIINELIVVKGIGEWTVHMFLIFCMGRLDVLATGDLGIKTAIKSLYSLDGLPTPEQVAVLSAKGKWHPYESIVCWYLWQLLDNAPKL